MSTKAAVPPEFQCCSSASQRLELVVAQRDHDGDLREKFIGSARFGSVALVGWFGWVVNDGETMPTVVTVSAVVIWAQYGISSPISSARRTAFACARAAWGRWRRRRRASVLPSSQSLLLRSPARRRLLAQLGRRLRPRRLPERQNARYPVLVGIDALLVRFDADPDIARDELEHSTSLTCSLMPVAMHRSLNSLRPMRTACAAPNSAKCCWRPVLPVEAPPPDPGISRRKASRLRPPIERK